MRHGEGGEGQHGLRHELVLPEHEAGHGAAAAAGGRVRGAAEAEEGSAREAVEGVPLDVTQTELHVEGGVVQVPEPVVCEGELDQAFYYLATCCVLLCIASVLNGSRY